MFGAEHLRSRTWEFVRRLIPWGVALGVLAYLFSTTDATSLRLAFMVGPWWWLAAFIVVQVPAILTLDAFATYWAFRALGLGLNYREVFVLRGTSYLLGIVSYSLGQGGLAYLLGRWRVRPRRAFAAVVVVLASNFGALVLITSMSLPFSPLSRRISRAIGALSLEMLALFAIYLLSLPIAHKLSKSSRLARVVRGISLKAQGTATVARLPHVLILVASHWVALRIWGIQVPFAVGLFAVPVVLFVAALPIAPHGLGTAQAVQVLLFSPYAVSVPHIQAGATVLAFGLTFFILSVPVQAFLSLACWRRFRTLAVSRGDPAPRFGDNLAKKTSRSVRAAD